MFEQDRIGVVDVCVDTMPAGQRRELLKTAAATRDREMIHLPGGPGADPQRDRFVVLPEGAIEEKDISGRESAQQRRREIAAAGHERADPTRFLFVHEQAHRVASLRAPGELWRTCR